MSVQLMTLTFIGGGAITWEGGVASGLVNHKSTLLNVVPPHSHPESQDRLRLLTNGNYSNPKKWLPFGSCRLDFLEKVHRQD